MSKTLLLADDSVVIQKLVGLSFANEDVEIIATDNGDDAIARAREVTPDIVLADVVMPGKSGYEVCEAIKQDPNLAHVPVLLLTGTFEAFDETRAAEAGANGQITKPFEAQSMVERVNTVIREAAAAPSVIETPASHQATDTAEINAASGISLGAIPAATTDALPHPHRPNTNASAPNADAASGPSSTSSEGGRLADSRSHSIGRDASESDFFDRQLTPPQLSADGAADEFTTGLDGHTGATDDNEVLLNSPGLENSQDLAADFSDSPLAAYAGPADSTPASDNDLIDDQAETIVSLPPISAPAPAPAAAYAPAPTLAYAPTPDSQLIDDGLGLEDALPLSDLISAPPPVDLDIEPIAEAQAYSGKESEGESARRLSDATILVGQDDGNASTAPSFATSMVPEVPEAAEALESDSAAFAAEMFGESDSRSQGSEALTVHAPSGQIDQDAAIAPSPAATSAAQDNETPYQSDVADLDASLNQNTQEALHIGPSSSDSDLSPASNAYSSESDPLHVGPTSVGGEDLDFAFDVSEQREVSSAEVLNEGEALSMEATGGADFTPTPTPTPNPERVGDAALVGDYDVSSSDLATAVPGYSDAGSDITSVDASGDESDVDANGTSFSTPLVAPITSGHYAVGVDSVSSQDSDVDDSGSNSASYDDSKPDYERSAESAPAFASAFASAFAPAQPPAPAFAPEPIQTGAEEEEEEEALVLGASSDRRVSDLSPLMEQRIQETLEKVAWEAFSDLSETIVKQVINRVEQVAWDVIPEMAETLVREEIRRMKGEED